MNDLLCVGDEIKCHVENPSPATLRAKLNTPEAVAMGNELIADKNSGWCKAEKEFTCVVCGAKTTTPKTLMHNSMHRYVCTSKCMIDFYA